jgi:aspartate racemase
MATVGLIGGIAPESTIDYYRRINDRYTEQRPRTAPSVVVNSIDLHRMLGYVTANRRPELVDYLALEIGRLERAGASFAAILSNTPHLVFDEIRARSRLPLLSIVEAARDAALGQRLKRLGLMGTRSTMQGGFYPRIFAEVGLLVIEPAPDEVDFIHDRYLGEIAAGRYLAETRDAFTGLIRRMVSRDRLDGVILGGTELPLLLRGADVPCALVDTTAIHVEVIVHRLLALDGAPSAGEGSPA